MDETILRDFIKKVCTVDSNRDYIRHMCLIVNTEEAQKKVIKFIENSPDLTRNDLDDFSLDLMINHK